MYEYNMYQWMLFFFIYCFVGWVWECCYVSTLKHKWVNRGFLHGPFLPIYGFGAITILWITLPVRESIPAIALAGAVGATVLEYVTGAVMEKLFHVRYWDYSNQKCNLNGYICLSSTFAWGVFSVILVRYVHQYIEVLAGKIPETPMMVIDFVLAAAILTDTITSVKEAFDLKAIILAEKEKELQMIAQSLALVKQNIEESSERMRENWEESTERMRENWEEGTEKLRESFEEGREKLREGIEEGREKLRENIEESTERIRGGLLNRRLEEREKLLLLQSELEQRMELLQKRAERRYRSAGRILKRNPSSTYQHRRLSFEELKEMIEKRRGR